MEEVTDILEIEERLQLVAWVHFEFIPKGGCSDSESSTALFCMYVCIFVGMHYLVQLVMVSVPLGLQSLYTPYLCSISLLSITPQRRTMILGQYVDFSNHGGYLILNWDSS